MKNFFPKMVLALLATWLLLSCAVAPASRPLSAEDRDVVIGNVNVEFQIPIGSGREAIMATAHSRLLERARLLYGDNVDIRNIEATRRSAVLAQAMMHGEDVIRARGAVISLELQRARARAGATEHAGREVRRVLPADARVRLCQIYS